MSASRRIREYLDAAGVRYALLPDAEALAAEQTPLTPHGRTRHFVKTVLFRAGRKKVMLVVPASLQVDKPLVKRLLGVKHLETLPESVLADLCPGCEPGAFPPFGNLYGMEVWVDGTLAPSSELIFNIGSHADGIRLKYSGYAELVKPRVASFAAKQQARAA